MASEKYVLWSYAPSPAAALLFLVLFVIVTIWHIVIMVRSRAWYFSVLVIGGCRKTAPRPCPSRSRNKESTNTSFAGAVETTGYVTRYLASKNNTSTTLFAIQSSTILVAPALFAASIYMVLGRLILVVRAEHYSPIRSTWMTKTFVVGDLVSFLIQVGGAGILINDFNRGKTVILVGLVAQLLFFGVFVGVAVLVWRRMSQAPTPTALHLDSHSRRIGWVGVMRVIFLTSALIFIRSIFRLVEFTGSDDSPMQKSEAYIYICDSVLMFGVLAVLVVFHPSQYVPTRQKIMQMRDEEELTSGREF